MNPKTFAQLNKIECNLFYRFNISLGDKASFESTLPSAIRSIS